MTQFSFDIESTFDAGEMNNIYDQVHRELANRYDLKGSSSAVDWLDDKTGFKLTGDQQFHLDALIDMVRKTAAKRGVDQKTFDTSKEVTETLAKMTWDIPFRNGLVQDDAKKITKILREELPKAKALIQSDVVRVMSPKKDELQAAMNIVQKQDFDFPTSFTNFR